MKHIYQLKITLTDSSPEIWRVIQVAEATTFSELHDTILIAMGWPKENLYKFTIGDIRIYDFLDDVVAGADPLLRGSIETRLNEIVIMIKSKFTYVCDFGDRWKHVIQLEEILPEEKNRTYPVCLGGENACPPADCGGIWRYQDMLRVLSNKKHPEFEKINAWLGDNWNARFFDIKETNEMLLDYKEQLGEINADTNTVINDLEDRDLSLEGLDQAFYDSGEDSEYNDLKNFTCANDVLNDGYQRSLMEGWLENALEEERRVEYQAAQRLCDLGFDLEKANEWILGALSIEWYYDLKYGIDSLQERYESNLNRLPEPPIEFPTLDDALAVLDHCSKGIPFSAIEYVQNNTSEEAASAILRALKNHSDHKYCWEDCTNAPIWYAYAAEGHLSEDLIDPVIELYGENANRSDWLCEQGQYLIGKLAEKYPILTVAKVLEAMEKEALEPTKSSLFYLYDVFYFGHVDTYKSRLLTLLEQDNASWLTPLAAEIAQLQIKEALPILKRKLEKLRTEPFKNHLQLGSVVEVEEAIRILEGELILDRGAVLPLSLQRENGWQDELKRHEHLFYDEEDYDYSDLAGYEPSGSVGWPPFSKSDPFVKEKILGRNDPCYCGSGKKYKKCCLGKD